jgi:hypothetical protein
MLSSGVLLPDSMFHGHVDQQIKQPKLRHGTSDSAEKYSNCAGKEHCTL